MKKQESAADIRAEIRTNVKKWATECKKTAAFKALPKSVRADFNEITGAFAEHMYANHLQTPKHWTAAALEDVLTGIFPRKILMSATFFTSVEPSLQVFFTFLHGNGVLKNHKVLVSRLKTSAAKMRRLVESSTSGSSTEHNQSEALSDNDAQFTADWRWTRQQDFEESCPCGSGKPFGECCSLAQPPIDSLHASGCEPSTTSNTVRQTKHQEPTLAQWAELYDVAVNLKKLELWTFLGSGDLITILLPEQEEPVFCSVMGRNGECYAIGLYPGYEAIMGYNRMASAPPEEPAFISALDQNCLMCYFGDRQEVSAKERKILKSLDLQFRGRNEWIYFRAMQPGYYPWYINATQADLLIQVLQNLAMASIYLIDQKLKIDFGNGETLLRFYSPEKELWLNAAVKMPPLPVLKSELIIENDKLITRLKNRSGNKNTLEFEITYLPTPIQESKEDIPFLPTLLLLADKTLDLPLDQYISRPSEPIESLVLKMLSGYMEKHGRPAVVYVRDDRTGRYLEDLCRKIGVDLIQGQGVPVIDKLLLGMLDFVY